MANTMTLIASYASTGSVGSISFTSIPSTYTDLQIVYSFRTNDAGIYNDISVTLNSNNSANGKDLYAIGSTVGSYSPSASQSFFAEGVGSGATASTFSNGTIYIPNYAGSTQKSISGDTVGENNAAAAVILLAAGLYSSTSAVTSVTFTPASPSSFLQYSTAYLYGVKSS
jgi:hypothetical protein